MASWQPATQPWRKPSADVLKKILSGTSSQFHILAVLHCSAEDYDSMVPSICDQLNKEGIGSTDTLASTEKRQAVKRIANALLDHHDHYEMLHWAISQGEDKDNVVAALCAAIRNVHAASKRRSKRIKSEPQEESASVFAPSSQAGSSRPPSTTPSKTSVKTDKAPLLQSPVKTAFEHTTTSRQQPSSYIVKLTMPDASGVKPGFTYIIAIPRALSDDAKYQHMRDEIRKRSTTEGQEFVLGELQSDGSACICDDPASFAALLDDYDTKDNKMNLAAMYTYGLRSGEFKPPTVDSDRGIITH